MPGLWRQRLLWDGSVLRPAQGPRHHVPEDPCSESILWWVKLLQPCLDEYCTLSCSVKPRPLSPPPPPPPHAPSPIPTPFSSFIRLFLWGLFTIIFYILVVVVVVVVAVFCCWLFFVVVVVVGGCCCCCFCVCVCVCVCFSVVVGCLFVFVFWGGEFVVCLFIVAAVVFFILSIRLFCYSDRLHAGYFWSQRAVEGSALSLSAALHSYEPANLWPPCCTMLTGGMHGDWNITPPSNNNYV